MFSDGELERRALESETFSQPIFNEPQVGEMQQLRLVCEENKFRRADVGLRGEENFRGLALFRRRRIDGNGIANQFIARCCLSCVFGR